MTFHEEASFKKLKEIECEIEDHDSPILEDLDDDSSLFYVHRENPVDHSKLPVIDELVELVNEPPAKRRETWCRYVEKDVEKNGSPIGSTRDRKQPDRYSRHVALMSDISDSEPSSYEEAPEQQVWKDVMT